MKSKLKRAGWLFLTLLFVFTGVGLGVWAFWQNTHPSTNTQDSNSSNKLKGKQLANFTPVSRIDSLQKIDQTVGSGTTAEPNSVIIVHYTGAVAATGVIFESSIDSGQPAQLSLNQVIKGWAEGIPGMKAGGSRRLLIPAALAYGPSPPPGSGIPANADLVFDVQLISVK